MEVGILQIWIKFILLYMLRLYNGFGHMGGIGTWLALMGNDGQ